MSQNHPSHDSLWFQFKALLVTGAGRRGEKSVLPPHNTTPARLTDGWAVLSWCTAAYTPAPEAASTTTYEGRTEAMMAGQLQWIRESINEIRTMISPTSQVGKKISYPQSLVKNNINHELVSQNIYPTVK